MFVILYLNIRGHKTNIRLLVRLVCHHLLICCRDKNSGVLKFVVWAEYRLQGIPRFEKGDCKNSMHMTSLPAEVTVVSPT